MGPRLLADVIAVSNAAGGRISVSCECCMLSGGGLCVGLIIRPEESCRKLCVSECDREASLMRRSWPTGRCCAIEKEEHHIECDLPHT